jgi:hypothetical protein
MLSPNYAVWNKIINRNFYIEQNIRFEEKVLIGDAPLSCQLMCRAQRVFYTDTVFYAYVQRKMSIMNSSATFKRTHDIINAHDCIRKEIQNAGYENELNDLLDYRYILAVIGELRTCYSRSKLYKSQEELKKTESFLQERFSKISLARVFSNPYMNFRHKIRIVRLKSGLYTLEKTIVNFFK